MDPISAITRVGGTIGTIGTSATTGASAAAGKGSFGASLEKAMSDVSRMQNNSQALAREFQAENPAVSLEETMISMQQSSLAFQAAVQVRNKLVTAYNEMMNMQV